MNKTKKRLLISAALILTGGSIFASAMSILNWNFGKLSTSKFETSVHDISGRIDDISISTSTADVTVLLAEDGVARVECFERKNITHTVAQEGDKLSIVENDERGWRDYVSISFASPKITVYLPEGEYGDLTVKANTGDVTVGDGLVFDGISVSADTGNVTCLASANDAVSLETTTGDITVSKISSEDLTLTATTGSITAKYVTVRGKTSVSVTTGRVELTDLSSRSFETDGNTGRVTLTRVTARDGFKVTRTTGNVVLEGCDGGEITIETDTGSVRGSLASAKIFIASSSTGRVSVPDTASGGICRITTSTGSINISVEE